MKGVRRNLQTPSPGLAWSSSWIGLNVCLQHQRYGKCCSYGGDCIPVLLPNVLELRGSRAIGSTHTALIACCLTFAVDPAL